MQSLCRSAVRVACYIVVPVSTPTKGSAFCACGCCRGTLSLQTPQATAAAVPALHSAASSSSRRRRACPVFLACPSSLACCTHHCMNLDHWARQPLQLNTGPTCLGKWTRSSEHSREYPPLCCHPKGFCWVLCRLMLTLSTGYGSSSLPVPSRHDCLWTPHIVEVGCKAFNMHWCLELMSTAQQYAMCWCCICWPYLQAVKHKLMVISPVAERHGQHAVTAHDVASKLAAFWCLTVASRRYVCRCYSSMAVISPAQLHPASRQQHVVWHQAPSRVRCCASQAVSCVSCVWVPRSCRFHA